MNSSKLKVVDRKRGLNWSNRLGPFVAMLAIVPVGGMGGVGFDQLSMKSHQQLDELDMDREVFRFFEDEISLTTGQNST